MILQVKDHSMSNLRQDVAQNIFYRLIVHGLVGVISIASMLVGPVGSTVAAQLSVDSTASSCPRIVATYAAGYNPYVLDLGDINGDSKLDLAVANRYGSSVSVALGNGTGGFLSPVSYPVGYLPVFVRLGDINGDGSLT
jgi:FG-GAP-like repeat